MQLTESQKIELNKLWFIYGNRGKKHTLGNHRFIQNLLTRGEDDREFYLKGIKNMKKKGIYSDDKAITQECISAVDSILKSSETQP
jgi:hypothetical protein